MLYILYFYEFFDWSEQVLQILLFDLFFCQKQYDSIFSYSELVNKIKFLKTAQIHLVNATWMKISVQ